MIPADEVFLDTAGLLALLHSKDAHHAAAKQVMAQLGTSRTRLVTSQWVLSEFLASASSSVTRQAAVTVIRKLAASPDVDIEPASHESWSRAFELYAARTDKEWSHADCASILACQHRGIRRVFTADRHFEQAGLAILITPT